MFYEVDAKVKITEGKNPVKEKYLIEAEGIPEAETKVIKLLTDDNLDYEVVSVKKSSVRKVILNES